MRTAPSPICWRSEGRISLSKITTYKLGLLTERQDCRTKQDLLSEHLPFWIVGGQRGISNSQLEVGEVSTALQAGIY